MKKLLLFCVVAVALMAAVPAHAASGLGLRGETGLVRTPMAAALPPLTLAVAVDFVSSDYVFLPLRMEFGVIEGLELGGNFWHLDSAEQSAVWGLNAKYVLPEFVENLGLAIGGHYREQTCRRLREQRPRRLFRGVLPLQFPDADGRHEI